MQIKFTNLTTLNPLTILHVDNLSHVYPTTEVISVKTNIKIWNNRELNQHVYFDFICNFVV